MSDEFEGYVEWARSTLGVELCDSLRIQRVGPAGDPNNENGVIATTDIVAGTVSCVVPYDAMLHVGAPLEAASESEMAAATALAEVTSAIGREDDALALRLLYERAVRGDGSKWARHVRHLPVAVPRHSLLRWTDAEIDELRGANLHTIATRWRAQVHSFRSIRSRRVCPDCLSSRRRRRLTQPKVDQRAVL
jgi:hypothetical protein